MAVRSISPQQAADLLSGGDGHVYLDVRSVPEFSAGHPRSARNIPLLHSDPRSGNLVPNPDFLKVVQANFPPATPLLLGCLSGGRSMKAAELLERAGHRSVVNVRCGFGGSRDILGRVTEPGWAALGLPVDREERPGESYESLHKRVLP
jgi:rhodanese-related sulfurtransferase